MDGYKFLFVDTETTGLCDMRTPYNEDTLNNHGWPYVTQLAFKVVQFNKQLTEHEVLADVNFYIKPEYPESKYDLEAQKLTGILYKSLEENGADKRMVIEHFVDWLNNVDFAVAHNSVFDMKMIKAECLRLGIDQHMRVVPWIDTMYYGAEYLRSIGASRSRFVKLGVLASYLHIVVDSAHSADGDVRTMESVFSDLVELHVVTPDRLAARIIKHQTELSNDKGFIGGQTS